jgi:hypothetical protein
VNTVTGALWSDYVPPRCTTCKPGPDGTWTGAGWTLIAVGAAVVLLGVGMLWFESRTDQGAKSQMTAAGSVVALGLGAGVIGLVIIGFSASRVDDDKSQLRMAAANVLSMAVDGPAVCREAAAVESQEWPSSLASSQFLPKPENCGTSPRAYAQQQQATSPAGVFIPVEYLYSASFTTDGEVTVHDKLDNRSLCVTVPDTDVEAAATAATPTGAGPTTLPPFDDMSVDPSPYITDGACADAPVSSPDAG